MASAIVSNHALLPLDGLGGPCYRACANDHMAIVPRAAADSYFKGVSRLLSECGSGPKFFADLTRRGNLRSPRGMAMGAEARFGPGYIFARVGLKTRSVPWPYAAFGARACGESLRLTPPRIEECVLPLQCERVEWLTREGMGFHFDGGPWEETLRRYVATCRAWTCAGGIPRELTSGGLWRTGHLMSGGRLGCTWWWCACGASEEYLLL